MNKPPSSPSDSISSSDSKSPTSVRARLRIIGEYADIDVGQHEVGPGDALIIKTEQGHQLAAVVTPPETASEEAELIEFERIANQNDLERSERNREKEAEAVTWCRERARELELSMKLIAVQLSHDGHAATYFFTSAERVDFRKLVKDLAKRFETKVEMKQIGVRDAARHTGGTGLCGRRLCCSTWLPKFDPISIRMAKDQNLTLNQQKLSGVCGRLRCCLSYEHGLYKEKLKALPKLGKKVTTPAGEGRVRDLDVLRQRVRVRLDAGEIIEFPGNVVERIIPPPTPPKSGKKTQKKKKKKAPSETKTDNPAEAVEVPAASKTETKSKPTSKSKGKSKSKAKPKASAEPSSTSRAKKKPQSKKDDDSTPSES